MSKNTFLDEAKKKHQRLPGSNSAGTGIIGLMGFTCLFLLSSLFFITENYFLAMAVISIAILVYLTGTGIARLMVSSFTIFFSGRHLLDKAVYMQETLKAFNEELSIDHNTKNMRDSIVLPDNPLVRDLQRILLDKRDFELAQHLAHSYYSDCLELYDYSNGHLEFVADTMPLFGLIGTILGLIAMFDGLGANVTVESLAPQLALALKTTLYGAIFSSIYKIIGSRFEQRLKTLEFDYEAFCYGLEVIVKSNMTIQVEE